MDRKELLRLLADVRDGDCHPDRIREMQRNIDTLRTAVLELAKSAFQLTEAENEWLDTPWTKRAIEPPVKK